jgi:hypothetical protein
LCFVIAIRQIDDAVFSLAINSERGSQTKDSQASTAALSDIIGNLYIALHRVNHLASFAV